MILNLVKYVKSINYYSSKSNHNILKLQHLIQKNNAILKPFLNTIKSPGQFKYNLIVFGKNLAFYQLSIYQSVFSCIRNLVVEMPYKREFVSTLVPLNIENEYIFFYLQQLLLVLKTQPTLSTYQLFYYNENIRRIIFSTDKFRQDDESIEQYSYHLHRQVFKYYLNYWLKNVNKLPIYFKSQQIQIAKFLKVYHIQFLQFIKNDVQQIKNNYTLYQLLITITYLSQAKYLPYQFFYKYKSSWIKLIQETEIYSQKRNFCTIRLLEILSKQKLCFCEKIVFQLLQIIKSNLPSIQGKQLVRILYFYSKAHYPIDETFVSILIERIYIWLPALQPKYFSLIVRSVGNLNYKNNHLIKELKEKNYQMFIAQLKYGCENLGQYYLQILKSIDKQIQQNTIINKQKQINNIEENKIIVY